MGVFVSQLTPLKQDHESASVLVSDEYHEHQHGEGFPTESALLLPLLRAVRSKIFSVLYFCNSGKSEKGTNYNYSRARGRLTSTDERHTLVELIHEARQCSSRLESACNKAKIDFRTYRRWYQHGKVRADKRPISLRPAPVNKLSEQEQQAIIDISNAPEYATIMKKLKSGKVG